MSGQSRATAVQVANQLPASAAVVGAPVLPCAQNRDPQLSVRVFAFVKGKRQAVQATVTANALTQAAAAGTGLADFSYVLPGAYRVKATAVLAPDDPDFWVPDVEQQVVLARGDKRRLDIEVKPRNVVTPKLDVEYKVVLLDRNLAQHQTAAGEPVGELLRPEPTAIEVSLSCSADAPSYTGGGTLAAPNCDVFLDAACAQPLGGRNLTHAELTESPPKRLYLRGTAAGLFTLSLTLDDPADPRFEVKPAVTQDMGVVTLELQVFQHATPVNVAATTYALSGYCADLEKVDLIPEQVVLSDADKVTKGRLLHKQSGEHHGRSKVVLKLVAAEWPAGTDDYQIVLGVLPSSLRAHDAEVKGKRQSLPLKTAVSVLKASDKTLWIEGTGASRAIRDVRLSLALDRVAGGLAKTPKQHGDWARFTVVKIESVALQHTAPAAGQPQPWNASKRRWYINYQAGDAGRTITIRAKLSQPIAGIKLHFMLSPDKDNQKEKNWGADMPSGGTGWDWDAVTADVKQKDKVAATDLLHRSQDTDAQGQTDCDLVLSRIGGDKFRPGVYIAQDPHLAAYVHGHDTLEERKPKLADNRIKVWRKFAYQKVKVRGLPKYPSTGKSEDVYGRVRAEMVKVPSQYVDAAVVEGWPRPSLLPEYMFKKNGSLKLKLNVSDANQAQFFNLVAADPEHPIKVVIVTCDFNWGNERNSATPLSLVDIPAADFPINIDTDVHVCDPPLQGGALLVAGATWTAKDWDQAANGGAGAWVNPRNGLLADGEVGVDPKRDGNEPDQGAPLAINKLQVRLPAGLAAGADTYVSIGNLVVQGAPDNFLGGYGVAGAERVVAVFDPKAAYDYQNTVVHELGHAFFQTGSVKFTGVAGQVAVPPAAGIPTNPSFLWTDTGLHCQYNTDKCVMFTQGPIAGSLNRYCPDCHPHLLVQDMSSVS